MASSARQSSATFEGEKEKSGGQVEHGWWEGRGKAVENSSARLRGSST